MYEVKNIQIDFFVERKNCFYIKLNQNIILFDEVSFSVILDGNIFAEMSYIGQQW